MKRRISVLFLVLVMVLGLMVPAANAAEPVNGAVEAVYLGVKDFTTLDTDNVTEADFVHRFFAGGEEVQYTVATGEDEDYAIQNQLMEGYIYDITVAEGVVTKAALKGESGKVTKVDGTTITVSGKVLDAADKAVYAITTQSGGAAVTKASLKNGDTVKITENAIYKTFVAEEYEAPVSYTPGKKTLKNFLAAALHPVGTALYVYGGGWDWEDDASSPQSQTIGIPQSWIDFYQSQDTSYHYKEGVENDDWSNSYYTSNRGWNQYYYAGIDCSAYVAWAVYNTLHTEDGQGGYVGSSTNMAYNFAQNEGWGTYDRGTQKMNEDGTVYTDGDGDGRRYWNSEDFKVGDIFSDNGHTWIVLGKCDDGSMVILHSTPSASADGKGEGGGIQLAPLDPEDKEDCQAKALCDRYNAKYFPDWNARYGTSQKSWSSYTEVYDTAYEGHPDYSMKKAGKFSWNLKNGILQDPEGLASMDAREILKLLFNEAPVFSDVKGHWAETYIEKAVEAGITKGISATKFGPEQNTTREQLMTMLARMSGADTSGDALAKGLAWAVENGVSDGSDPKGFITREQLVTMLYRYAGSPAVTGDLSAYADADTVSAWAEDAMIWAVSEGIIDGIGGKLMPKANATRAQIVTILVRYADL